MDPSIGSEHIEEVGHAARAFCAWFDSASNRQGGVPTLLQLTAQLFTAAAALPFNLAPPEPDSSKHDGAISRESILNLCAEIPFQYYSEIFDPFESPAPEEPVTGDIADDLADIYSDVSRGLFHFERGKHTDALESWSFSFATHWGEHATSAIRALYWHLRHAPDGS